MENQELRNDMLSEFEELRAFFLGYSFGGRTHIVEVFFDLYNKFQLMISGRSNEYGKKDNVVQFKQKELL